MLIPVLFGHLQRQLRTGDAGIVDQNVNRSELLLNLGKQARDLVRPLDMAAEGARLSPRLVISATVSAAFSARVATQASRAPASASSIAIGLPRPRLAPVTTATFPEKIPMFYFSRGCATWTSAYSLRQESSWGWHLTIWDLPEAVLSLLIGR